MNWLERPSNLISATELDTLAQRLVEQYSPDSSKNPVAFNIEGFMKDFLGLNLEFRWLNYRGEVLGLTLFKDGYINVHDEENHIDAIIPFKAGTVVIDKALKSDEPRLRFTCAHESAHWLLHKDYFLANKPSYTTSALMEQQANFMASAILMPLPALRTAFKDFFIYFDERPRRIIRSSGNQDDLFAALLPDYISQIFKVSKQAALIRLEKLTAIV